MSAENNNYTVISLGGSLFVPDAIDTDFLKSFKEIITERVAAGEKFVIITGGGKTCRRYQAAGRALGAETQEESDWIGIYTTRMHAEFMRIVFGDELARHEVIGDPEVVPQTGKPIIFGAGWEPGWSTDYDAVMVARTIGATRLINLSNIAYVYDTDPKENPDAQPQKALTWEAYRAIIPSEWEPGLNTPFDPIASREAAADDLEVIIMDGSKLDDLKACLSGSDFEGTRITNT